MFGDKLLFGQTTNLVDSKNRMFIPASTEREKGDKVYLVYDNDIHEYKIVPYSVIEAEFKIYEKLINSAKTVDELTGYKLMLTNFAQLILRESIVDAQGRIVLTDDFIPNNSVTIIGSGNHLILRQEKQK